MRDDAVSLQVWGSRADHVYPVGRDEPSDSALQTLAVTHDPGIVVEGRVDWPGWLAAAADAVPGCVLLDRAGAEGGELSQQVAAIGARHATIVLTDSDQVAVAVAAMRAGAFDVLRKPVAPIELTCTIHKALAELRERTERLARADRAKAAVERLSPREQVVMAGLIEGLSIDALACRLGLSARIVAADRARVMQETGSTGIVDLMRCALAAGMLVES